MTKQFSVAVCAATMLASVASAAESRPNVLLILVDDLGWCDLSTMGSTYYETPNVDKIARNGVKFMSGYAGCSVSSPSRGSILTGKSPVNHGITDWIGDPSGEEWRKRERFDIVLPADYDQALGKKEVTIAEALSQEGYRTGFVGKWHLGEEVGPTDFGFDVNIGGWKAGSPVGGYFSPYKNPALEDGPRGENLSMRLAQEAVGLMKKDDKPTFTMLSFYAVHGGIQTTNERWEYYRQKALSQGVAEQGFERAARLPVRSNQDNPVYAGLVEQMDLAVGYVLDYLEESGKMDNTIVIFTSDNGGVVSGDSFSTSLKPLRGGKGNQWEGGIRVPYIIWNPAADYKTSIVETPVIGMDLYPTVLDLVGAKLRPKQHIDGVSLRPLLEGEELESRNLYWHYPHYGNQGGEPSSIVRSGDWKLIYYHEDGDYELYNLADDLGEQNNLADKNPEMLAQLKGELTKWLKSTKAKFPTPDSEYDEAVTKSAHEKRYTKAKNSQERCRTAMYSPDWKPNATWWDSLVEE